MEKFCNKCRKDKEVIKPDYLKRDGRAFRCIKCNSKIFISKKELKKTEDYLKKFSYLSL